MANWDVTTAGAVLEFDTANGVHNNCFVIDSNHFINFWAGGGSDGFVQVFEVNTTTWAVTTAGARIEFDTVNGTYGSCFQIDSNHFINFWAGLNSDGYVQVFEVNTTTWAVTTAGAVLEFDTVNGTFNSCYQIDGNHFINFWAGSDFDGFAQVFEVNTTTWAVTTAGAVLEFDTVNGDYNNCFKVDTNHFINFWGRGNSGQLAQVFTVNTTTWAVTTSGAPFTYDTDYYSVEKDTKQLDANKFLHIYGFSDEGIALVIEVNTTTWAVTTASSELVFVTGQFGYATCEKIDDNHFIAFYTSASGSTVQGFSITLEVNTTTWAVTTASAPLEFTTTLNSGYWHSCARIDASHYINFRAGTDADGFVQVFEVEVPSSGNNYTDDLVDSVGLTDTISKQSASTRPLVDSLGLTDTINLTNTIVRSLQDSIGLTDSLGDNDVITRSLVDSIGLTDSLSPSKEKVISLTDSIGITDNLSSASTITRPLIDDVGVTDVIGSSNSVSRSLVDSIGTTDNIQTTAQTTRSIVDSIGISDILGDNDVITRSLVDNIGIEDTITSSQGYGTNLTDSVGVTDTLSLTSQSTRSLVDALGLTDTLDAVNSITRGLTDSIGITDTLGDGDTITRSLTDNVGLTDVVASEVITPSESTYTYIQHAYFGAMYYGSYTTMLQLAPSTLEDSIGITDNIQTQTTYVVSLSDSVGVTDTITESSVTIRELQDDEGITDTNNVGILHVRSLVDGVGITDEVIPTIDYLISLVDSVGITDDVDVTKATVVSLQDDMGITDEGAVIGLLLTRELQDNIGLIDDIISTLIYKKRSIVSGEVDNFKMSLSSVDNIPVKMGSISDIKLKLAEIEDK